MILYCIPLIITLKDLNNREREKIMKKIKEILNYMCDNCGSGFDKEEIVFKEDNSLCKCCYELYND